MTEAPQILLEYRLKSLRLPTVLREYSKLARQSAAEGQDHVQFLARLIELEMIDRGPAVTSGAEQTTFPDDLVHDAVLRITAEEVKSYLDRASIVQRLVSLRREARAKLHSVPALVNHLLAPDPILTRFYSTRARFEGGLSPSLEWSDLDRRNLRDDARVAWQFIEKYTHPETGLCAGTAQDGPTIRINRDATMWDVASQMFGIQSAVILGLIEKEDGQARVERLLRHLPTVNVGGTKLPAAIISSSTGRAQSHDFDVCDTGRFLIALSSMVKAGLAQADACTIAFERYCW